MASCDPIESPSGRECDDNTKRWRERTASTICAISGVVVIGIRVRVGEVGGRLRGANVVQELLDAVLARDRLVVEELDLRRALEAQPRSNLAAEKRRRPPQRAIGPAPRRLVTERGVVDARLLQVGRDGD